MAENQFLIQGTDGTVVKPAVKLGRPVFVDHDADLGAHPGYMADSQFIVADLKAEDGTEFGFCLHMMNLNPEKSEETFPLNLSIITLTNYTTGEYMQLEKNFFGPDNHFAWKTDGVGVDVETEMAYIRGKGCDEIEMGCELPDGRGRIDFTLNNVGPILDNMSVGMFPFMVADTVSPQYAITNMDASGTLQLDGKTLQCTGKAWYDRQWTDLCAAYLQKKFRWSWLCLCAEDGTRGSVWDVLVHDGEQHSWCTIVTPDGGYHVADVEPLDNYASDYWTSPVTGQSYATAYRISAPAIGLDVNVKVRGPKEQEIVSPSGDNKWEGGSTFEGTFNGKEMKGWNYVELVGSFRYDNR